MKALNLQFDERLSLEFYDDRITADIDMLGIRVIDEALGLTEKAPNYLRGRRGGLSEDENG